MTDKYSTDFLIKRAEEKITVKKPKKLVLPKLRIVNQNKYSYFMNIAEVAEALNRPLPQLKSFIESEIKCSGNFNQENALVMSGIFRKDKFELAVRNFFVQHVICNMCSSPFTSIEKDDKLSYILCNKCHARKYL